MALLENAVKDFGSCDQIRDSGLQLKDGSWFFLSWANPLLVLPIICIDLINLIRQDTVITTLQSWPQGPPGSEDNSAIPTFRRLDPSSPLSPCLTPSALSEEGSEALLLSRRIHEDISSGRYECLLCEKFVRPASFIWSCWNCSLVLHLSCVEQHMRAERSPLGWHCPTCHNTQIEKPQYTCWCGKQVKPLPLPGLPPHSCSRTCSRVSPMLAPPGKSCCDGPCEFICHAGYCPPCGYEEPLQDISSRSSEDKARHPRSKRTHEEMDEPTTQNDDSGKTFLSISRQFR
jgi:hypothetical protein